MSRIDGPSLAIGGLLAALLSGGCTANGIIDIEFKDGVAPTLRETIEPQDLLAYELEDGQDIFVAEGQEARVAALLEATVEDGVWTLPAAGGAEIRKQKELVPEDWYDHYRWPAIVKWTVIRGMDCQSKPAGSWLGVYKRKSSRRPFRWFETTQDDWWCIKTRRARGCKVVLKEIPDGTFWTRPPDRNGNPRGRPRTETRKLSACSPC